MLAIPELGCKCDRKFFSPFSTAPFDGLAARQGNLVPPYQLTRTVI
jgi:hypothetical protein